MIRERVRQLVRLRSEAGKFTKSQAYYVDEAFQAPVRCGNCEYFDSTRNTCDLVSEQGPPNPGIISRAGACSLFNARPPRIQTIQWLWGRAEKEGIAPERVRASAFMITYAALDEEPPTELEEKAWISADTIKRILPGR